MRTLSLILGRAARSAGARSGIACLWSVIWLSGAESVVSELVESLLRLPGLAGAAVAGWAIALLVWPLRTKLEAHATRREDRRA